MTSVIEVDNATELQNLIETNQTTVINFGAKSWCVPCQRFAPHFEKAAEKSDATFVAVDIDKAPWAVVRFGIQGVPTVKLYRDGEFVDDLNARTVVALLAALQF